MKSTLTLPAALTLSLAALALPGFAQDQDDDKEIRLDDCPAAVKTAIEANLNGASVEEIERVTRAGVVQYHIDAQTEAKDDVQLHFGEDGTLLKREADLKLDAAPEAVRAAVAAIGGTVEDLDEVTEGDQVTYHADIQTADNRDWDLVFSANGDELSRAEDKD